MAPTSQLLRSTAPLAAFLASCFSPLGTAAATDPPCIADWTETRAVRVTDPRSIDLGDGRVLRLAGIEPFSILLGDTASDAALTEWIHSKVTSSPLRVALLANEPDRYGRLPAIVATTDGELVQEAAVRHGLAIPFSTTQSLPCFDRLLRAEDFARRHRRGFWKTGRVMPARPEALRTGIGRFAIFEGTAVSVGNRPYGTYLNFGGRWSEDVTVEIAPRHRAAFGGEAGLAKLAGRRVRVRGFVEDKGGPMLAVQSPLQVEILETASDGDAP